MLEMTEVYIFDGNFRCSVAVDLIYRCGEILKGKNNELLMITAAFSPYEAIFLLMNIRSTTNLEPESPITAIFLPNNK